MNFNLLILLVNYNIGMIYFLHIYYQPFTRRDQIAAVEDATLEMTNFKLPNGSDLERILRYFKFGIFYSCNLTPSGERLVVNVHETSHTNTVIDK